MKHYLRNERNDKEGFAHVYQDVTLDQLNKKAHDLLLSQGYKLKEGSAGNGVYEKGNRVLRILLGAFVRYFKFHLQTGTNPSGEPMISVFKSTSGMSGGLIGMSQVKKDMQRVGEMLAQL